ncbi:hypothetical protein FD12_GL001398 [Lentilactobacillus rapi DSM 19907 = JCM 15042]|uniref:Phage protein n=4 Tax=Lactobacillaceae TaxID=33958 RepID=A0A512PLE3_9LACO|nr:hypothetical protein [Lentilactobacillus rapi]KRL17869.1 hypothetical protein FD12_GL001398 [Lentilactobacillus rapi DSM 19907 = JCM 15042]GEP72026.1 hypothetical protein LRA02_08940 [Lentilactobacillus rapi]
MITEYDKFPKAIEQFDILNSSEIHIGVLHDKHLQMIAIVNNDGATIRAKNVPYLMVPTLGKDGKRGFVRLKEVHIPHRRFMEKTKMHNERRWLSYAQQETMKILAGDMTAMHALHYLGNLATEQMKTEIIKFANPANAPLTIANKGFNDPLIDTGALRDSITYRIVPKTM